MAGNSLLRPLFSLGALALLLLAGCASLPNPAGDTDSLFVMYSENPAHPAASESGIDLLRFRGPSSFTVRVGKEEKRGYYVRVKPGRYTVEASGLAAGADRAPASAFEIPPGVIILYPLKVTRVPGDGSSRVRRLAPLIPEDQKSAAALLTDYIDYGKWFGRASVGFGAYPPRLGEEEGTVEFDVASTPPGAQVTIDRQAWGAAPVKTRLHTGRHLLQLEIPGTALTRRFVDVQSKGEINVTLSAGERTDTAAKVTVLLTSFQNMGSPENDQLRPVFPQTIGAELQDDDRLLVIDAVEHAAGGAGIPGRPDFTLADQEGIDLIVSGYYTARQDALLVYAALYDVQSESVRASVLYTGKVGLAMFDSIDEMAAQFVKGVDVILTDAAVREAQRAAPVDARIVSYERRRAERELIEKRQAMRSSLAFVIGPSFAAVGGIRQPSGFGMLLAVMPLGVVYDHSFGGPFSLTASLQSAVAFESPGSGGSSDVDYVHNGYLDIPLKFGPEYTLFGARADLSFSLQGEARYIKAYFDNDSGGTVYKPLWVFGLGLQTSARLYLQSRVSESPSFFLLDFTWFLLGMQTKVNFSNPRIVPIELSLLLGYGFRL